MSNFNLRVDCESTNIVSLSTREVRVELINIDKTELINDLVDSTDLMENLIQEYGIEKILEHFDSDEILDKLGTTVVCEYASENLGMTDK